MYFKRIVVVANTDSFTIIYTVYSYLVQRHGMGNVRKSNVPGRYINQIILIISFLNRYINLNPVRKLKFIDIVVELQLNEYRPSYSKKTNLFIFNCFFFVPFVLHNSWENLMYIYVWKKKDFCIIHKYVGVCIVNTWPECLSDSSFRRATTSYINNEDNFPVSAFLISNRLNRWEETQALGTSNSHFMGTMIVAY